MTETDAVRKTLFTPKSPELAGGEGGKKGKGAFLFTALMEKVRKPALSVSNRAGEGKEKKGEENIPLYYHKSPSMQTRYEI